jgi:hypothetical protein
MHRRLLHRQRLKRLLPKCAWAMSERQTKWWDNWWDNDDVLELQNDQDVFAAASNGNLWGEEDMGIFDVDDDDIVAEVMEAEDKEAAIRDLLRRHGWCVMRPRDKRGAVQHACRVHLPHLCSVTPCCC